MIGCILICVIVGLRAFVGFAPSKDDRWHQPIAATQDKDMKVGAVRVLPKENGTFEVLETALRKMERTTLLAGSSVETHVTYVTRSKWFGFPDYTTLEQSGDTIKMFARLRFGRKDFGVNAARLQKLVAALE